MIRLLLRLFRITDFDTCKSCETLKQQLEFERSEKKELLDTVLKIVNPKVIEAPVTELNPVVVTSGSFSKRRAALEAKDREEARLREQSDYLKRPDKLNDQKNSILKVEKEIEKIEDELKEAGEKTN